MRIIIGTAVLALGCAGGCSVNVAETRPVEQASRPLSVASDSVDDTGTDSVNNPRSKPDNTSLATSLSVNNLRSAARSSESQPAAPTTASEASIAQTPAHNHPLSPATPNAPPRVAVLHLGRPAYQSEYARSLFGIHVTADSLLEAIPLLEQDHVTVVILEVNCQGGFWSEASKVQRVIEEEYMPRFRTVAWIHEAVSAAAMCMIAMPELYFQPAGIFGACPGWVHRTTPELTVCDPTFLAMEAAARRGGHEFKAVRSMLLAEPLSIRTNENGGVEWLQNESGTRVLNRAGHVFTMNAADAVKYGFARGSFRDLHALLNAMGLDGATMAGSAPTQLMDDAMAAARDDEVQVSESLIVLRTTIRLADSAIDGPERDMQIEQALVALSRLRDIAGKNPLYATFFSEEAGVPANIGGMNKVWFDAIMQGLDRLRRKTFPPDDAADGAVS